MYPVYEEQRAIAAAQAEVAIKTAMESAKLSVESTVRHQKLKQERIAAVTEDYIRRGYLLSDWGRVGEFGTPEQYVKRLAKEMKRPFVSVSGSFGNRRYTFPKAKKYAPLYATLMLLADKEPSSQFATVQRPFACWRQNYWLSIVRFKTQALTAEHDVAFKDFEEQAATNPVWISLLKPRG